MLPDLTSDAGLVDTLLHAQDRAYSVLAQILRDPSQTAVSQFSRAGRTIIFYFPEGIIRSGTVLRERAQAHAGT